ncbi:MAG: gamma-glutamyltransferase family protein [Myxococcales bacterium]|nr:gamma-glutamyltransferase family protein [Myxococcales bacterium]
MLREGGNATDAAVAAAAALAVTEPVMTGLGGDCFALVHDASTRRVHALNGSGRAPAALDLARLERDGVRGEIPRFHAHTVTVPGAFAGWCDALERHGSLPLDSVLAPAIELAEEGFPVAPITAELWKLARFQLDASPGGRALQIDGRAPAPGERFRNADLARTLRALAEGGRAAFYEGDVARAIERVVRDHGGALAAADLAEHASTFEDPISLEYRGLRVWECAPNGQGLAALIALGLVRGLDLASLDPLGPERFHAMIEAMRLAFADARAFVADPAHARVPVDELLSETYLARRRDAIDPSRANPGALAGRPLAGSDTVYLCAVDAAGNACSFINSNYQFFGTGLVPEGCGFALQNRGAGFSLDPRHPNVVAPRKRPYHTIIPGMLTHADDGALFGPFGVMGGFMQPQGHLQVVVALADDGEDPQSALDRPRFQLPGGEAGDAVQLEEGLPADTLRALAARGHETQVLGGLGRASFGRGQIVQRTRDGVLWGGSDPRADGCAMPL